MWDFSKSLQGFRVQGHWNQEGRVGFGFVSKAAAPRTSFSVRPEQVLLECNHVMGPLTAVTFMLRDTLHHSAPLAYG